MFWSIPWTNGFTVVAAKIDFTLKTSVFPFFKWRVFKSYDVVKCKEPLHVILCPLSHIFEVLNPRTWWTVNVHRDSIASLHSPSSASGWRAIFTVLAVGGWLTNTKRQCNVVPSVALFKLIQLAHAISIKTNLISVESQHMQGRTRSHVFIILFVKINTAIFYIAVSRLPPRGLSLSLFFSFSLCIYLSGSLSGSLPVDCCILPFRAVTSH